MDLNHHLHHHDVGHDHDGSKSQLIHDRKTQVICGTHKVRHDVTQMMRHRLGYEERVPMVGERIICCKNQHSEGLYNGGQGTLLGIAVKPKGAVAGEGGK